MVVRFRTHLWVFSGPSRRKDRSWFLWIIDARIAEAEPYGDMLTCPHGHYEVWERWRNTSSTDHPGIRSLIALDEYEEWPRGRIVYSSPDDQFVLYADAQILSRPDLLTVIYERFGLTARIERT
jgi:hypothetical protein